MLTQSQCLHANVPWNTTTSTAHNSNLMQVTEAQNAAGTDSAPGTAQQQQQQADALSAAAQQPDRASVILSEAAKPLEAPEPDQYTVRPSPGQKEHFPLLTLEGLSGFEDSLSAGQDCDMIMLNLWHCNRMADSQKSCSW